MLKASLNEAVGLPPQMDLSSDKTMTVSDAPLVSVNTASDNNTTADKKDIDDIKFTAEPERYQLFVNESNALSQVRIWTGVLSFPLWQSSFMYI